MQVVHEVCCGLDVHKKSVTACVLWASGRRRQTREFGTFTRELLGLADWLRACGVRVAERLGPFQSEVARLCTIPGVDRVTAWGLLAEIGLNMGQFPDAQHLASWAGLCPGSHESAGKRKSGKIRKGSLWLRRCLCQGPGPFPRRRTTICRLSIAGWRRAEERNARPLRSLLVIAYYILRDGTCYHDLEPDYA